MHEQLRRLMQSQYGGEAGRRAPFQDHQQTRLARREEGAFRPAFRRTTLDPELAPAGVRLQFREVAGGDHWAAVAVGALIAQDDPLTGRAEQEREEQPLFIEPL